MLYRVDRDGAAKMLAHGTCYKLREAPLTLALARPPRCAEDKRGLIQSRNPSVVKKIVPRSNKNRGRGPSLRGGKGAGFEHALIAVATKTADQETVIALESWNAGGRKNEERNSACA